MTDWTDRAVVSTSVFHIARRLLLRNRSLCKPWKFARRTLHLLIVRTPDCLLCGTSCFTGEKGSAKDEQGHASSHLNEDFSASVLETFRRAKFRESWYANERAWV